jgi:hypothetical protein
VFHYFIQYLAALKISKRKIPINQLTNKQIN